MKIDSFKGPQLPVKPGAQATLKWEVSGASPAVEITLLAPDGSTVAANLPPTGEYKVSYATGGKVRYKLRVVDGVDNESAETPDINFNVAAAKPVAKPVAAPVKKIYDSPAAPAVPVEDVPQFSTNAVTATVLVAKPAECKRVRLAYHLFAVPGVKYDDLKRFACLRTNRWVRRVFAQAGIAPKIEFISAELQPPVPNMISILNFRAKPLDLCTGLDSSSAASKILISVDDNGTTVDIEVTLPPGTPGVPCRTVGTAIAGEVTGKGSGLVATVENVPRSDKGLDTGCDIFLSNGAGPVKIGKLSSTDASKPIESGLIQVPGLLEAQSVLSPPSTTRADEAFFPADDDSLIGGDASQRRVLRVWAAGDPPDAKPRDSRIDIYVVPRFRLAGRAYPDYRKLPPDNDVLDIDDADFDAPTPLKNAVIIAYETDKLSKSLGYIRVMDGSDASPFTLPHEIGHVLGRVTHNGADGDVMAGRWPKHPNDSGLVDGTPDTNGVRAAKHIYGGELKVGTLALRNNQEGTNDTAHYPRDMRQLMRTRCAHLLEDWT